MARESQVEFGGEREREIKGETEREKEREKARGERGREQRHRPESTDKRMPPMPHHHATHGTSQPTVKQFQI